MLEAKLRKQLRDYLLDLEIRAEPGKILVLIGENGAGKTTVLNMLSGLLEPDSGSVRLNGRNLFDSSAGISIPVESRRIGYVLQRSAVFPHISVADNVAYGMKARHLPRDLVLGQINRWMDLLGLGDLASVKAGKLSGGQKQRVAIARVLATEPDLIMLDEPFTALDAESTAVVKRVLGLFVRDRKIPCILVTHRIKETQEIGDAACMVSDGTIRWQGHPSGIPVQSGNSTTTGPGFHSSVIVKHD